MKTLSINDIVEQEKGPIWVVNSTNEIYPSGADVYVTLINKGQSSVCQVPRTWLPIELTNRYPRKIVVESPYFIEALSKGLLKSISAETAEKLLKQPGVAAERKRLEDFDEAVRAATQARGIGKNVSISTGDIDLDKSNQDEFNRRTENATKDFIKAAGETVGLDDSEEDDESVSANFRGWVEKINTMESQDEARNEVKLRGNMEISEATYLMEHCVHSNIKSSLAKRLKAIAEEEE